MYLDDIADCIRKYIPDDRMPEENVEELLRIYAVLLRAKGTDVTESDIHDAWSTWIVEHKEEHKALIPYEDLTPDVREQDAVFANAVRQAAQEIQHVSVPLPLFEKTLFPAGPPTDTASKKQAIDLYKMMVASSESLVSRRQAVNTFFLTMNGVLLTAFGLIVKSAGTDRLNALGIFVLAIAGAILCCAWRSLITSFGQLNRGKFQVINTIERYLNTAIYAAEWEALERGENPKVYRSFTSREIWVPNALLILHILTAVVALLVASGIVSLPIVLETPQEKREQIAEPPEKQIEANITTTLPNSSTHYLQTFKYCLNTVRIIHSAMKAIAVGIVIDTNGQCFLHGDSSDRGIYAAIKNYNFSINFLIFSQDHTFIKRPLTGAGSPFGRSELP